MKKEQRQKKKKKKRLQESSSEASGSDVEWKPDGSTSDEEESANDSGDEGTRLRSPPRRASQQKKKAPAAPKPRGQAAAAVAAISSSSSSSSASSSRASKTTQQAPRQRPRSRGGSSAEGSSAAAVVIDVDADDAAVAAVIAADLAEADEAGVTGEAGEAEAEWWLDTTNHTGNYSAEYAKTGRAKCRVCGELIKQRELRMGLECDEKGWGVITRWQHLDCTRLPKSVTHDELDGYDALTVPDQQKVREMLSATGPPEHLKPADPDEEVAKASAQWTTQREPPDSLLAPMLPYQKEGLGWMCAQEEGPLKGGILADEMGMGKTLQTISLMCAHKTRDRTPPDEYTRVEDGLELRGGGTLVIVPVIALAQWRTELLKWTAPGEFSVYTYHGPKRESSPRCSQSTMWCLRRTRRSSTTSGAPRRRKRSRASTASGHSRTT